MLLLNGLSLAEKQRLYYNGSHCPYCGNETEYIDSARVYQESHGMVHYCEPCQAWCGTLPGSDQSVGMVAKAHLRSLRIDAHKSYDPLIDAKVKNGSKRKVAQIEGRKWLAEFLGIELLECHIGYFDVDLCERTIAKCKSYWLTEEQVAKRKADIDYRVNLVFYLADKLGLSLQKFDINGNIQLEIKDREGRCLYYNPVRKEGRMKAKKKPSPIEDIEEYILKTFKNQSVVEKLS